MKKAYIYLTSFFALVIVFTISYYVSFESTIGKSNSMKANPYPNSINNNMNSTNMNNGEQLNIDQSIKTQAVEFDLISPYTEYTLQNYDIKEQELKSGKSNTPEYLIGLTRKEVLAYLDEYMKNIPFEEYQKGLISYELVSFSSEKIVLRKNYNSDKVNYQYYLSVENGLITVYYSDKKTVYDYTDIEVKNLAPEDQERLNYGVFISDLQELYGMLESYSS